MPSTVGRRTQTYCTAVGKALIAFLPTHRLNALIEGLQFKRHTRHTLVSSSALKTELERVRRRGFAVDNEEVEEGLRCIAAPIRDYTGNVVASLGVAGPIFRIQKSKVAAYARAVTAAADNLSTDLGYVRPHPKRREQDS